MTRDSYVSREMTCGALEGRKHAGKGLLAYWERANGLLGNTEATEGPCPLGLEDAVQQMAQT